MPVPRLLAAPWVALIVQPLALPADVSLDDLEHSPHPLYQRVLLLRLVFNLQDVPHDAPTSSPFGTMRLTVRRPSRSSQTESSV